jgi:pyridoxal phosphate enzyme (YggS family)
VPISDAGIAARLATVRARIAAAAAACGRDPTSVQLLAVSKTKPAEAIAEAYAAGQRAFGENYLQEAQAKMAALADLAIEWHFIGRLQSNKTRAVAAAFAWVHSLAELRHAERLSQQRPANLGPLNLCLQVNVSGEASKGGVAVADLETLAHAVTKLDRLRLRGLMTMPDPNTPRPTQRRSFARLRELRDALNDQGLRLDTLSMGMSNDLEDAIAEGSTLVRVGTAIFGARA